MMTSRIRKALLRYASALAVVAVTTVALRPLRSVLDVAIVALLYMIPVGVSSAMWGQGPGILAAVSSFLVFNFIFVPPYLTLRVLHTQHLLELVVFLVVALVINQLVARTRRSLDVAREREREATRLYALSAALVGEHDRRSIACSVAEQVMATFGAGRVEVGIGGEAGEEQLHCVLPERSEAPHGKPSVSVPVQGLRGLIGEISLWLAEGAPTAAEMRLLGAFAGQAALSLERARLAETESRARVLEQSDRLKSALLSSVSHELRSPLATIKASVTSLRSDEVGWDSEARRELLTAIEEETDHLNQLVSNLLDMSRIETGSLRPQRTWNVLAEIVRSVTGRMRNALRLHDLAVDVSEDLPLVPVDYVEIEQVFVNLISNSLKHSPPASTIRITAAVQDEHDLLVRVENQGPGVAPGDLAHIFDRFTRVTAADRVTGTGLGLSICKGIVEAHGGRIWAENVPGGLAFCFTLPRVWPVTGEEVS